MQLLPIGESDFKTLRKQNYYFVDKSLFIKDIVEGSAKVSLITRPRRFGKTLNMTMLRYFLDITQADENRELFKGLAIENDPAFEKHFGKYPVIYLSFKDLKSLTFQDVLKKIAELVSQVFQEHDYVTDSNYLDKKDIDDYLLIRSEKAPVTKLESSLKTLSKCLFKYWKTEPYILIDEYDTPIHTAYHNSSPKEISDIGSYYYKLIAFMKSFLGSALKDNVNLHKGVLTGILRVAKESIFSELNNPGIFTVVTNEFASYFGFTTVEVDSLLADIRLTEKKQAIENEYFSFFKSCVLRKQGFLCKKSQINHNKHVTSRRIK
jgi:hypothetical protein